MVKPSKKALGKRKAPPLPSKDSKKSGKASSSRETQPNGRPARKPDQPKKIKLRDQRVIPVPRTAFAGDGDSDEDMEDLGEEEGLEVAGGAGAFLASIQEGALSRSVKETKRLHDLAKSREQMPDKPRKKSGLRVPSPGGSIKSEDFDSDEEWPEDLDSELNSEGSVDELEEDESGSEDGDPDDDRDSDIAAAYDDISPSESEEEDKEEVHEPRKRRKKDDEAEYERPRWAAAPPKPEEDSVEVGRLPIKLPSGEIQQREGTTRIALPPSKKPKAPSVSEEEDTEEEEDIGSDDEQQAKRMAGQKGKFGRMGVAEIVDRKGWKNTEKLEAAKEQIAGVGAEVLAGGELVDIAPLLTRISTFSLPTVPSLEDPSVLLPVPNSIRGLALLSQLAVYKDLIPGYRIRALTEVEEAEKVRDEVRRMREGEKMLVRSYKGYLKSLEGEIKRKTPLASLALRCMADLLSSVTHFNFSENIMGVLVGRLARKSWDEDSDLILSTFISVFQADVTAAYSQSLVRLIARMMKERKFQVHPNVLGCLLCLRLRGELEGMKDGKRAKKDDSRDKTLIKGKKFKSETRKKWATKNERKREKEMKEVRKEMAEAEAEVDKEERAQIQTETLKNLFVLYFSILKSPTRTPLLPGALEGISVFAHLINVDFFRDLLKVLRKIIVEEQDDEEEETKVGGGEKVRLRLLAIVTAFELLSGQGEVLNIDLSDFVNALFGLLRPLSLDTSLEDPPFHPSLVGRESKFNKSKRPPPHTLSTSQLLFLALNSALMSNRSTQNPTRSAAFAKRLVESALFFPPRTARLAVAFVRQLMAREPKVEGLLDTEERMFDGVYKAEGDDPAMVNPFAGSMWEVELLKRKHLDRGVKEEAAKLAAGNPHEIRAKDTFK